MTPEYRLYHAVKAGQLKRARQAIADGADPCLVGYKGKSLLRLAGENGHLEICYLLAKAGLDVNETSGVRNFALIHNAAASGNIGFLRTLLELGANPNALTINKQSALHFAARMGCEFMCSCLIEQGANLDQRDNQGRTPLFLAVAKGNLTAIRTLIKAGADKQIADRCGRSIADLVSTIGDERLRADISALVPHGDSPNYQLSRKVAERPSGQREI